MATIPRWLPWSQTYPPGRWVSSSITHQIVHRQFDLSPSATDPRQTSTLSLMDRPVAIVEPIS